MLRVNQLQALLYLFVGLTVLTLIALVVYVVVSVRKRNARSSALPSRKEETPDGPLISHSHEQVLALVRENQGAPVHVEIDGRQYLGMSQIDDPEIRRRVVAAAMELVRFTGALGGADLPLAPVGKIGTWREDLRAESGQAMAQVKAAAGGSTSLSQTSTVPPQVELEFLGMLAEMGKSSVFKPTLASSLRSSMTPKITSRGEPRSFVHDIDDIVQRKVLMIPALVGRGLHVSTAAGGEVVFDFDGKSYSNVEDIPNTTACDLIRDAIREWEELA